MSALLALGFSLLSFAAGLNLATDQALAADPASATGQAPAEACKLSPEQGRGSMIGAWEKLPITLVADRALYLSDNGAGAQALRNAVKTWNDWAARKGKTAFVIFNDQAGEKGGMLIPDISSCAPSDYTKALSHTVGIWKIDRAGASANARKSCGARQKLVADGVQAQTDWEMSGQTIENASVLLNFDYFQAPGRPKADLESLLVHELGHVLGLLHSCNGSSEDAMDATSAPSCDTAPKEFLDAAMFPYLRKNTERRAIAQNDLDRVNCLY